MDSDVGIPASIVLLTPADNTVTVGDIPVAVDGSDAGIPADIVLLTPADNTVAVGDIPVAVDGLDAGLLANVVPPSSVACRKCRVNLCFTSGSDFF